MKTLARLMSLKGRKALVSGGAGHVGRTACEALTELGAVVTSLDLPLAIAGKRAKALSRSHGNSVIAVTCDLGDAPHTRSAVRQAIKRMRGLDILIHCAALVGTTHLPGWAVPFEEQSVEAWEVAMRVNLTSAFVMAQEAKAALEASGHGSVILIASTYGFVGPDHRLYAGNGMGNPAGYGASKGGLLQLARYLATTLAPKIRVNAISPGGIWRNQPPSFHKRYVERTPLARMATEEDLKGAIAYLASDLSAYVTGHNLVVDGGWTAW